MSLTRVNPGPSFKANQEQTGELAAGDWLRVVYRKLPAGTRRNMMRYFGFNFRNESKQAEEEGTEADSDGSSDTPASQKSTKEKASTVAELSTRPDHEAA